jgi:hypothetical protein
MVVDHDVINIMSHIDSCVKLVTVDLVPDVRYSVLVCG